MAIGGGKVLAVGTTEDIKRLAGPETALRDFNSANTSTFIFPGFNDAHMHLGSAGHTKLNVDLTGVKSLAEMLAKIADPPPTPRPPATGSPAATGTTRCGPRKRCPRARISTKSPAIIPRFSIASTATSPSPTPPRSLPPASPARPSRRRAEPSISTPMASPQASFANPRRSLVYKVIPPPTPRRAPARRRTGHRRRALPRRDQRAGLQRLGGFPRLRGDGKRRQAQSPHHRVAALQGSAARSNQNARITTTRTIPCSTPAFSRASWMARSVRAPPP